MSDNYDYYEYLTDLGQLSTGGGMLDFTSPHYKDYQTDYHIKYMLNRTQKMFVYDGLPETIKPRILEFILQTSGNVCLTKVNDKCYAFFGGLGGEPDENYQPTIYTIANPYLKFDANLKIGEDCVWGRSDSIGVGLLPLFKWYASMIVETGLSLRTSIINTRIIKTISATDDRTAKSAIKYLEDIENGKLGVISDSPFFEGLNIDKSVSKLESLTDLIETLQYLKASWFNDLGLQANYNMKRERIQNAEAENDNDALLPLVDDMLSAREEMLEQFNSMYGYNATVKLSSAWEDVQQDVYDTLGGVDDTDENNTSVSTDQQETDAETTKETEEPEEPEEPEEQETPEDTENIDVNIEVNINTDATEGGETSDKTDENTTVERVVGEPDNNGDIHTD